MAQGTSKGQRLTPAGRRVLDAASDLFYREGIHAVGVDALAAAAGVTKKTLYACFGSKDALVASYLRERDQRWRAFLTEGLAEHADSPRTALAASFDVLQEWMDREDPRGCGFVNALAELPSPQHPGHAAVLEQKRWLLGFLTDLATAAGLTEPAALAETLLLLHEGAVVTRTTGSVPDATRRARSVAETLVASAAGAE
ncbi:TetR/AcrR family transcriptional regulator [Actinoalloteichus hymeniacidonis]|uniref:Transcriptional regulator, TetR family n=1 Tax=Actinoalloteichus hymeniacidonis TaxID=340345 RepID=A0AAC9MXN9_9PSEU|nr:TetR/AcrR family transcriptional regulator [Actinoalloteichus hymeniacidonis]AOS62117.1 transcriptional regulator, TetR family [Actinoalloteichus hymeniacidonis]MBB5909861.1 AcrR family transcriptional regulator [Actinoalloteichus hymeniacidonis]